MRHKIIVNNLKLMNSKKFGILSSTTSGIIITLVAFIFKINLIAIDYIGKFSIYFWLILLFGFLSFTFLRKNLKRKTINWMYLNVVMLSFIYLNSMLHWAVECCPDKYESMYDWNASKGLAWVVHLPLAFIIILVQGFAFDFLREQNLKRNKTSSNN